MRKIFDQQNKENNFSSPSQPVIVLWRRLSTDSVGRAGHYSTELPHCVLVGVDVTRLGDHVSFRFMIP